MKRIKTLTTKNLKDTMKKGGCGECQTSCQSACKTSCTVGNQSCENKQAVLYHKERKVAKDLPDFGRVESFLIEFNGMRIKR